MDKFVSYISTICGAFIGWFWGEINGMIYALIVVCFIDYLTGVFAAGVKHALSSAQGFKGIARKVTIFALVGLAHVIDQEFLGHTALLRDAVIFFYLANEGISIIENSVTIGIPVPEILKKYLLKIKDYGNENHEKIGQERKIIISENSRDKKIH